MHNTDESVEFLRIFRPEGQIVITTIIPDGATETRSFNTAEETRGFIEENQGKKNIYFTVNPVKDAITKKPSKKDIAKFEWLYVDCDPQHLDERDAILHNLENFVIKPTVIVDSGNGYQAYWHLRVPIIIRDTQHATDLERYTKDLETRLNSDSTHNVDRIFRLPGTVNIPNAKKRGLGRVPVMAQVVDWSHIKYDLTTFQQSPATVPLPDIAHDVNMGDVVAVEIDEIEIPSELKQLIKLGSAQYESGSELAFAVIRNLLNLKIDHVIIAGIVIDSRYAVSSHFLRQRDAKASAFRQIARCLSKTGGVLPDMISEMNQRHALVMDNGKARILNEIFDPIKKRVCVTFSDETSFSLRYANKFITIDEKPKPLSRYWMAHKDRREYDSVVFAPAKEAQGAYNLWEGWGVDANPNRTWEKMKAHILDNICSGNKIHYEYLLNWLASAVQKPFKAGQVAVVLRGGKGIGKGVFAHMVGQLFGAHFTYVANQCQVTGRFNSHFAKSVMVFADEAFWAGDKAGEAVVKAMITEKVMLHEAKGKDAVMVDNCIHMMMASNAEWSIPASNDERRFFVLNVREGEKGNNAYFDAIEKEMSLEYGKGVETMFYDLMYRNLTGWRVQEIPHTDALSDQKARSFEPEVQWWYNKLADGEILPGKDWGAKLLNAEVYADYIQFSKDMGTHRRLSPTEWGIKMHKMSDLSVRLGTSRNAGGMSVRGRYQLHKELKECRELFDKFTGVKHSWHECDITQLEEEIPF